MPFLYILTTLIFISFSATAYSEDNKSEYTSVDVKACKFIDKAKPGDGEWAKWKCSGYNGYDVNVVEADLRYYISFGANDQAQRTLSPFNTIGKNLEWRLKKSGNQWEPIATILRHFTDSQGKKGQVLVIAKFDKGVSCHMAYVDALANKEANKMAQYIADKFSSKFTCGHDEPLVMGKSGISPM